MSKGCVCVVIRVGCCGFPVSMKKYFGRFGLVEVNRTFYEFLRLERVRGWRERAPEDFEFTVKVHQSITHRARMKANEASLEAFERMKEICRVLGAGVLVFQTPGSFGPERLGDAEEFFRGVERDGLVLVWETRGAAWERSDVRDRLREVLEGVGVGHVVDPFRVLPVFVGEVVYFRLHGLGERLYYYQFSDGELRRLGEVVRRYDEQGRRVYVLFNNLAMFEDAGRFLEFLEKGRFPGLTGGRRGLDSVREVLERTRFPVSKSVLLRRVGWRLVVLEDGRQVRLGEFLEGLPSKSFGGVDEVLGLVEGLF